MKPQLLCTFLQLDSLIITVGHIYDTYGLSNVANVKCYMYEETPNNGVCVYNVLLKDRLLKDTILINRKKESNTLYSINALNSLIITLNNGFLDKNYRVDWSMYQDTLLLSGGDTGCRFIKIKELSF